MGDDAMVEVAMIEVAMVDDTVVDDAVVEVAMVDYATVEVAMVEEPAPSVTNVAMVDLKSATCIVCWQGSLPGCQYLLWRRCFDRGTSCPRELEDAGPKRIAPAVALARYTTFALLHLATPFGCCSHIRQITDPNLT